MPNALYEVAQLVARTGEVLGTLPVTGISYGETLNAAGPATIGIPLSAADPDTLIPGVSGLAVLRDGSPVWGGMLWTAEADLEGGTLTLGASGWHSYYAACYLGGLVAASDGGDGRLTAKWSGYSGTKDQALLLRDWIERANDDGGIGTDTSRLNTTGRIRSRSWGFSEFKNTAEAVDELADEDGGFDFRYETYWKSANRIGNRIIMAPHLSSGFPTLTHRVDCNVGRVTYDGSRLASRAYAFGADLGTGVKPYSWAVNDLAAPTLTQVVTYSDLKATADLVPKANALAVAGRRPVAIPTLTLYPGVFGPSVFLPGAYGSVAADSGYVRLLDDFVLTERRVDVDTNGTETVSLSLANKDVFTSADPS